jgi:hypothetical protein
MSDDALRRGRNAKAITRRNAPRNRQGAGAERY